MKNQRFFNDSVSVAKTHEPKRGFSLKRLRRLAPFALVLAACAPAVAPTQDVQSVVNTAVAQQAAVDMATMQAMLQNQQPPLTPTPEVEGNDNIVQTPALNMPPVQTYDGQGQETQNQIPSISISGSGVPQSINHEDMPKWSPDSDFPYGNTMGLGTEGFLRLQGTRTVATLAEEDQSAWSITKNDVQKTFEQAGPSNWWAPEGGAAMFTFAGGEIQFKDINGNPIDIKLTAEPNHGFIVIVTNHDEDATTPNDGNLQITVDHYNPPFAMGTALPKGQFVSEDYFKQNAASVHMTNCGDHGCYSVTGIMIDRSGAYTIINQQGNQPWTQVATNIDK